MSETAERNGFELGILWAAWWLHRGHGEDTFAEDLILECAPVGRMQRLARAEGYQFRRGFWARVKRKGDR